MERINFNNYYPTTFVNIVTSIPSKIWDVVSSIFSALKDFFLYPFSSSSTEDKPHEIRPINPIPLPLRIDSPPPEDPNTSIFRTVPSSERLETLAEEKAPESGSSSPGGSVHSVQSEDLAGFAVTGVKRTRPDTPSTGAIAETAFEDFKEPLTITKPEAVARGTSEFSDDTPLAGAMISDAKTHSEEDLRKLAESDSPVKEIASELLINQLSAEDKAQIRTFVLTKGAGSMRSMIAPPIEHDQNKHYVYGLKSPLAVLMFMASENDLYTKIQGELRHPKWKTFKAILTEALENQKPGLIDTLVNERIRPEEKEVLQSVLDTQSGHMLFEHVITNLGSPF